MSRCWSRLQKYRLSLRGTLMCVKETWSSTSITPEELLSQLKETVWAHTTSPVPPETTSSWSTDPGCWDKTTAWWRRPWAAERERAYRCGVSWTLSQHQHGSYFTTKHTDQKMRHTSFCSDPLLSHQGSHVTRWPGFYILQWRLYSSPSCTSSSRPRVDDVLASLQVSSHKCRVMYFTEVLLSTDFRSVSLHRKVLSIKTPLTKIAHLLKIWSGRPDVFCKDVCVCVFVSGAPWAAWSRVTALSLCSVPPPAPPTNHRQSQASQDSRKTRRFCDCSSAGNDEGSCDAVKHQNTTNVCMSADL